MRKWVSLMLLASLVAAPVMGQEATEEATEEAVVFSDAPWVCPEGFEGQTLSVYNWSTYIAEDTVANFEELCGVTVTYDVFESGESLLARLRNGNPGYDIIVPPDYVLAIMVSEGIVAPLTKENIPNLANLEPTLTGTPYDPENEYSVPYQWGTIGVGYNLEAVGEEITSWEQVWNYGGNVAWLEDSRSMLNLALSLLGYEANTTNPDEIAEARDYLLENGQNVVAIAQDDGQVLLERGDVDIAIEYSGDIFQVIADAGENYAYVIPVEGAPAWIDMMAIPSGAPNQPLAEAFIDYILDPHVGADISNYTAYGSPNRASIELGLIDEELLNNPAIYPSDETMENLFFNIDLPEAGQFYNDAWDELKILLGQ